MASAYSAPVAAFQVGNYFVRQYYQVLQQQPDYCHQFYNEASTMVRYDGDKCETATAMLKIHSLVMSLSFTGIEIKLAHSVDSWNGGILVTVAGSVQTKDSKGRRKFIQTFFLAPQEKGYFVLNDIFHFVDEEPVIQHPPSMLAHANFDAHHNTSNSLEEPDYILSGEVEPTDFVPQPHPEETATTEEYVLPEQHQVSEANSFVEEAADNCSSIPYAVVDNTIPEAAPSPVDEPIEPVKQTYASILRVAKSSSGPTLATQVSSKSASINSEWQQQSTSYMSNQSQNPALALPEKVLEVTDEISTTEEEDGSSMMPGDISKSVYVRNLPTTVSPSEIKQELKAFGKIKPEGVVVRSRKDIGICYAFVEFEDVSSVQNAIKFKLVEGRCTLRSGGKTAAQHAEEGEEEGLAIKQKHQEEEAALVRGPLVGAVDQMESESTAAGGVMVTIPVPFGKREESWEARLRGTDNPNLMLSNLVVFENFEWQCEPSLVHYSDMVQERNMLYFHWPPSRRPVFRNVFRNELEILMITKCN
ncbi:putative G3BP-like protein [Nymphaea thermarum]|nr:putative G3BP-like protein [Nymphaea thermarum]